MTSQSVNDAVLDAFRVEHREQLEKIRTLLGELSPTADLADDGRVQDAFRLAHSLKGGARVCDLREPERLGHGLEAVLERIAQGELRYAADVRDAVALVLDAVEDWMTAFDEQQPLPDVSAPLAAVHRVLEPLTPGEEALRNSMPQPGALQQVFEAESMQRLDALRRLLTLWNDENAAPSSDRLAEAYRQAHTLAGAAGVVGNAMIAERAQSLEALLQAIGSERRPCDDDARAELAQCVTRLAAAFDPSVDGHSGQAPSSEIQTCGPLEGPAETPKEIPPSVAPSGGAQPAVGDSIVSRETVRVSVESLDRLMRSSAEMLADSQRVSRFSDHFQAFQRELIDWDRQRESVRQLAGRGVHRLAELPEFRGIAKYLECVDRNLAALLREARQLADEQRQTAWLVRARSQQIHRDVRDVRMAPAHSVWLGFRKMVRDLAEAQGKVVEFQGSGLDACADRMVLQALKDPVMHILRNSVTHGIETPDERLARGKSPAGRVTLSLEVVAGRLHLAVEDDGKGLSAADVARHAVERGLLAAAAAAQLPPEELLSLVFRPGFSTSPEVTELAGRGMGLSIVHDCVARLQGQVQLLPQPVGVRVCLSTPVTVSTHRVLLVRSGEQSFAVPTHAIDALLRVPPGGVDSVEGCPVVMHQGRPARLLSLSHALGLAESPDAGAADETAAVVLLKSDRRMLAVSVDAFLEQRDALILPLDELARTEQLAGAIVTEDGAVVLVVEPAKLVEGVRLQQGDLNGRPSAPPPKLEPAKILIVDDSFTTRTLEKSILEAHGFQVGVAVDGAEALTRLRHEKYALVVSDVEMPRIDGFALLEQMKADRRLASIPVVLVTSRDKQEDQRRGLSLGAEAYIVKRKFDHQELLDTIQQVL